MNFCENCENMLYMRILEMPVESESPTEGEGEEAEIKTQNKIVYYCRCCNNEYPDLHKKTVAYLK